MQPPPRTRDRRAHDNDPRSSPPESRSRDRRQRKKDTNTRRYSGQSRVRVLSRPHFTSHDDASAVPEMIRRLLIANRGEIAIRIIRACRELGVETVAVYSDADRHAPHVAAADRAVDIGPSPPAESYLSIAKLMAAAQVTDADALHPGYGFLSENPALADACERARIVFVGPPSAVIARMGSKIEARRLMASAGVPVVPGETPGDQTDEGLRRAVEQRRPAGADQGIGGRRRQGHAGDSTRGRPRRRRSSRAARSHGGVRRRHALCRAPDRSSASHRGADLRRPSRSDRAPVRAGVLGAAPPSEGRRRKPVAGADAGLARPDHRGGCSRCRCRRISQRGHGRVPSGTSRRLWRGRSLLLSRDEHALAGRASRDGRRHRPRPRTGPAAGRLWRAVAVDSGRRWRREGTPSKRVSMPRIRRGTSFHKRAASCSIGNRECRECVSTRASPKAARSRFTTIRCWPR